MGKAKHYKNTYRSDTIRLKNYDYGSAGWYFVTICTKDGKPFFGEIRKGIMGLNKIGNIASKNWRSIPDHFDNVRLDEFIIMPNHIHGLIGLEYNSEIDQSICSGVKFNAATNGNFNQYMSDISPKRGSLSSIIRTYKGSVTRWCNKNKCSYFAWQPCFYDHIVRNRKSLNRIREYIYYNPIQWNQDDCYIR